jgi:hypothetical protein
MLAKLSAKIFLALTCLSLCLQFKKQYFWRNHRGQVQHLSFHLGLLLMFLLAKLVARVLLGSMYRWMRCVILDHVPGFVRLLFLALSVVTPSDVAAIFLSIGRCCGCCIGLIHLERQGKGDKKRAE